MIHTYRAHVISVYDGDTITCDIDLGLGVWCRGEKIRLFGINAPEVRGEERPEGLSARDYLRALIEGQDITVQTIKDRKGKYGRYLGIIFLGQDNINDRLVDDGYAVHAEY